MAYDERRKKRNLIQRKVVREDFSE